MQTIKVSFGQKAQLSKDPDSGGDRQRQAGVGCGQATGWKRGTTNGTNTSSRPRQTQGPNSVQLESLWGMEVDEDWVSTGQELGSQSRPPTGQDGWESSELNLFPGGVLGG